jgi:aminoglycoside 6'-N-acetyltransferase
MIDATDGAVTYAIEADGQVIGLTQDAEENELDYRHASIDIFVDPA